MQPNQDIKQLLQAYAGAGIDPNLYEVNPVYEDILRTTGIQEANLGGTSQHHRDAEPRSPKAARMTSMGSNIDDLNDLLTQLARNGGQILLREMSQDRVKKIVGQGAVWPANPERAGHRQRDPAGDRSRQHGPAEPGAGDRQCAAAIPPAYPAPRHRS